MSLKESDWKAVLDQPKNLGLKAGGGTGVGAALKKVAVAEQAFAPAKAAHDASAVAKGGALHTALHETKTLCEGTVKKHKSLYTAACAYLTTVAALAGDRMRAVDKELQEIQEEQHERSRVMECWSALHKDCIPAGEHIETAKNIEQLRAAWQVFVGKLEGVVKDAVRDVPKLQTVVHEVKDFKPADPNDLRDAKNAYGALIHKAANEVRAALNEAKTRLAA
jgi:hypothetical protein